ncbi:type II toxin-antitoxin system prevent-host-death family antitoxin [Sulfobacillus thermosulfidooxidans]|uniref:type II toxin-antitoxin system prevent-host-death family antitoxin n=1 Tax=Sulfobacillus thermosulfidooxidans TaxID=28034 RepID=UPI0006B4A120|nr:type II toxin-antitoxin system prevent-host-death family antitoxin [Sulfobacillus thermosulfidooxidans]
MEDMFTKPRFAGHQIVRSEDTVKHFDTLRQSARKHPVLITDHNQSDTVLLDYDQYKKLYQRLSELEQRYEASLIEFRINRIEKNPHRTTPWRQVKRTPDDHEPAL